MPCGEGCERLFAVRLYNERKHAAWVNHRLRHKLLTTGILDVLRGIHRDTSGTVWANRRSQPVARSNRHEPCRRTFGEDTQNPAANVFPWRCG